MRCRTSGPVGEPHHLLDQRLAAVVGRVGFPGDDQLDRPFLVEQQLLQPVRVAQHQRQPLVGRHPPGEPDGQHVGIECRTDPTQFGLRRAAFQPRAAQPRPDVLDQQRAQLRADPPQMTGVDLLQPQPDAGIAERRIRPGQLAPQLQPLRRRPGARVHAVGDRPDRHLGGVEPRPQLVEHRPADPAVQQRDAVGPLGQPQAHVRHVELLRIVLGAEREDPGRRHARQQRGARSPGSSSDGRRSTAAPSRPGTGRYRRAPGCGW